MRSYDFREWFFNEAKKKSFPRKAPPPMLGDTGTIPSGIGPTDDDLDRLMEPIDEPECDNEPDSPLGDLLSKLPKIGMPDASSTEIEINWKPLSTGKSHKPKSKSKPKSKAKPRKK